MLKKVVKEIERFQRIIIMRHKQPDFDAYGSQLGLYYVIQRNFPEKDVFVVGDDNQSNIFDKKMDSLSPDDYKGSLLICTDTSSLGLLSDLNYKYAKKTLIIDHHENRAEFGDLIISKPFASSASEVVAQMAIESGLQIPKKAAECFFIGIVGDSNRFLYKGTTSNTFEIISKLMETELDIFDCYKKMQKDEKENEKRFKGYVLSNFKINGKVAYCYLDKKTRDSLSINEVFASRATINLLSGIEGTQAFVNFTESDDNTTLMVELRSREISIVDVAKSYGGGGHALACGCKLKIGDDYMKLINDLNKAVEENK